MEVQEAAQGAQGEREGAIGSRVSHGRGGGLVDRTRGGYRGAQLPRVLVEGHEAVVTCARTRELAVFSGSWHTLGHTGQTLVFGCAHL